MTIFGKRMLCASAALAAAAGLIAGSAPRPATALTPAGELAPHRAIYELKLAQTRGNATVSARIESRSSGLNVG